MRWMRLIIVFGVMSKAKTLGRGNPFNAVKATIQGLSQLRDPHEVRAMRKAALTEEE